MCVCVCVCVRASACMDPVDGGWGRGGGGRWEGDSDICNALMN